MNFTETVEKCSVIFTEGALIERLKREFPFALDPHISHAGFIYGAETRALLKSIFKEYWDISCSYNQPMISLTPTWRATPERLKLAGFKDRDVNRDCVQFLQELRSEYGEYSNKIFIGGLMGCKGDAYNPKEALSTEEACQFHQTQCEALVNAGVDFLFAKTMPALSEAIGLAQVMAASGKPYIISFVIRPEGILLDGTSLKEAISVIDSLVKPNPTGFMVNCVHPTVFRRAMLNEENSSNLVRDRIIGLQANTSPKSPEELDGSSVLHSEDPVVFAELMLELHTKLGTKILGGCCGTDNRHIDALLKNVLIRP